MSIKGLLIKLIQLILPEDQPQEQIQKYFVKGFSGMLLIQVFAMLFTFLATWLLTRFLGKSDFGKYSYLFTIFTLAGILATFGYRSLIVRETAAYMKRQETAKIKGLIKWSARITFAGAIIAYLIATRFILHLEIVSGHFNTKIIWIAALSIPLLAFTHLLQSILNGMRYVLSGNIALQVFKPLILLCGIALLYLLNNTVNLSNSILINAFSFAAALMLSVFLFRYKTGHLLKGSGIQTESKVWIKSGLYFWVLSLVTLANGQADLLILGMLKPMEDVGIYKISLKLAEFVPMVLYLTNIVVAPVYARLWESTQKKSLQHVVNRSSAVFFMTTIPIVLILVMLGKPFMHFFGPGFESGYPALLILMSGQLVNVLMGSVGLLLKMTRNEDMLLYTFLATSILNILLDLLLIPTLGIEGAAIANAASVFCWNIVLSRMLWLKTGIKSSVIISKLTSIF